MSQDDRICHLVFHYTAVDDTKSIELLIRGNIGAHYLIPLEPEFTNQGSIVFQLVSEGKRAWHAGVSSWGSRNNFNDTSIGIEIVNRGFTEDMLEEKVWYLFSEKQVLTLSILQTILLKEIIFPLKTFWVTVTYRPCENPIPGRLFP
ncbi:N-acetylmuramoyl-L-alanine amidase [Enterobacter sp. WCHEn045836]|uniref:N-acetylmuramoyl-L-alanine amidase n=1 Tax=Enterobacter sp. WCHEn045836 TaxID=2497434 RepID=UPI0021ADA886|nr:N-acetylmuramoyl-L-alanine amidase [Enterobacter sp. WCHEn045836]